MLHARCIASSLYRGLLAAGLLVMLPCEASTQEVQVDWGRSWVDHELLGSPSGIGVSVRLPVTARLGIRLGFERYRDEFGSFGSTCVGLVAIDEDCEGEPRTDRARTDGFTLAGTVAVLERDRVEVFLVPGVRAGSVRSAQTGERTERTRSARKDVYGMELGGEIRIRLQPSAPLFAHLEGSLGLLRRWDEEHIADGYTPFEESMRVGRVQAGFTVGLP